jgi:predicted nucleic acid-binding protein
MATSKRPRVFLDTNVIVSGLHSPGGPPSRIVDFHSTGLIRAVVSKLVVDESIRTAQIKLPTILLALHSWLTKEPPEIVAQPPDAAISAAISLVPFEDAPILAAALAAEVDFLVTGDRTFLREARKAQSDLAVLSPREFLDQFEAPE